MPKNLFITGKPACGKTKLIKELSFNHRDRIGGFYTEEMKNGNERLGFILKTFDGKEGVLARKGMKSPAKLNKYGIDLNVLENIGVAALREAVRGGNDIIVVDEIGSMEVISEPFRAALLEVLAAPKRVLATIRFNSQPFTDEVKQMADTELVYLSRENYPAVREQVLRWLEQK